MPDNIVIEPHTVTVPKKQYAPKWLAKYAASKRMPPMDALDHLLKECRTNSEAARVLGVAPLTLYRNMKKWGVKVER